MIRRLFCALLACMCLLSGALAEDMSGLVRLHVVAENDSPAAQALKMEIRDVCLKCAEVCIGDAPDSDTAYMRLNEHLDDFESACLRRARELGYTGGIAAETGIYPFPDRIYGALKVPAGDYRALRITIGKGEGHNWWCILYPTLCMLDETQTEDGRGIFAWLKSRFGGA